MECSEEQAAYINNPDTNDSRLIACAGSGKTFCILGRIESLVNVYGFPKESIIMATFSKNAQTDFVRKIRKQKITAIDRSNCFTIDSLARRSIGDLADITDVSILSYTFNTILQQKTAEEICEMSAILKNARHIMVDEAQDLNATQYAILMAFKTKLGIKIHLVGDPNQNVYQFRKSSDKYLVNFDATTFYLTKNFRSSPNIVEFSSYLRPYADKPIVCTKPVTKAKVSMIVVKDNDQFESTLMKLIEKYQSMGIPLEKCALLAPTKGKIQDFKGLPYYIGLCYVANLLCQNGVKFSQFYSDSSSPGKIEYKPQKDHINLMTFHGSKGLEWQYVIVIDANAYLITKFGYNTDNFAAEQFLLYVACSRAVKNMAVITQVSKANTWMEKIPSANYYKSGLPLNFFDESKLQFKARAPLDVPTAVTRIIGALTEESLYELSQIMTRTVTTTITDLATTDWGTADTDDDSKRMFIGTVMENYFMTCALGKSLHESPLITNVRNIVERVNIIVCYSPLIVRWYFENKDLMTWPLFEQQKTLLDKPVMNFIEAHFDKAVPFNSYTVVDKFYEFFVNKNRARIVKFYNNYMADPFTFENVFNVSLVNYAIATSNYFYIEQIQDIKQKNCTCKVLEVAENVKDYCEENMQGKIRSMQEVVSDYNIQGAIDFIDTSDMTCEIKCVRGVSLVHVLQVLFYDIMRKKEDTIYTFALYNLYDGKHYLYRAELDDVSKARIIEIFCASVINSS